VRKHRPTELAFDALPATGLGREKVLEALKTFSTRESPMWRDGRVSGGVYHGDETHLRFLDERELIKPLRQLERPRRAPPGAAGLAFAYHHRIGLD
jgi:hypothetical protein